MDYQKIGISMPAKLVDRIEENLAYGDSRSQRIRNLLEIALAAENVMVERGLYHPSVDKREAIVREALKQYDPDEGTALS